MNKIAWNFQDLTGQVFGDWTVLRLYERRKKWGHLTWLCQCKCGREKVVHP